MLVQEMLAFLIDAPLWIFFHIISCISWSFTWDCEWKFVISFCPDLSVWFFLLNPSSFALVSQTSECNNTEDIFNTLLQCLELGNVAEFQLPDSLKRMKPVPYNFIKRSILLNCTCVCNDLWFRFIFIKLLLLSLLSVHYETFFPFMILTCRFNYWSFSSLFIL